MEQARRPRRLRGSERIRRLVRETRLHRENLIYPIFVVEGNHIKKEIPSLPGQHHFSVDQLNQEIREISALGIKYVLLFGIPNHKDALGTGAYDDNGIVQQAVRKIKEEFNDIYVITDICMCQYTDHGHCGVLTGASEVNNDETLEFLGRIALSHVKAGADMVAPSDMMDGRIGFIRKILDQEGYVNIPIMSYCSKYASKFYGPFRDAAHSAPSFGDRKTYQMDPANASEALMEAKLDLEEGADILMVKPALAYLDIIRRIKENFNVPIAAYNVSGEYAMLKLAIKQGLLDEEAVLETITAIKRAGADIIITYFAKDLAKMLKEGC